MIDEDPLRPLLREWQAPEPADAMDRRIRAAWRVAQAQRRRPRGLGYMLTTAALVAAALLIVLRPLPRVVPPQSGYVTRLGAAGFQPLPDGATRVVPVREVQQ